MQALNDSHVQRSRIESMLGLRPGAIAAQAEAEQRTLLTTQLSQGRNASDRGKIEAALGLKAGTLDTPHDHTSHTLPGSGSGTAVLGALFGLPGSTGKRVQLLPAGEFKARDGRPGPDKSWRVSDSRGMQIAGQLTAVAAATPIVIDYEHQTINAQQNGKPAPAAGWIKSAAWEAGRGLFALVEWTAAATAEIVAGRYRYISPVITFDQGSNEVTGVILAALTNHPALLGMEPVSA